MNEALKKVYFLNDPLIGLHIQKMIEFCAKIKVTKQNDQGSALSRIFKYGPRDLGKSEKAEVK